MRVLVGTIALVTTAILAVSALTGVPGGERVLGAYLDASAEANLATW